MNTIFSYGFWNAQVLLMRWGYSHGMGVHSMILFSSPKEGFESNKRSNICTKFVEKQKDIESLVNLEVVYLEVDEPLVLKQPFHPVYEQIPKLHP